MHNHMLSQPTTMDSHFNRTLLGWILCVTSVLRTAFQSCGQSRQNSFSSFTESFKKKKEKNHCTKHVIHLIKQQGLGSMLGII